MAGKRKDGDGGETGRAVLPEFVPDQGDHGSPGPFCRTRHRVQHQFVIQTNFAGHIGTVDQ